MQTIANYIDGNLIEPQGGAYLDNVEPATGKVYSQTPDSDEGDVQLAVDAATRAFQGWSQASASERSDAMLSLASLVEANLEKLARAETIDNGKPLWLARMVDIPRAVSNLRFFATAILHTSSEVHFTDGQAINYTMRQPAGVAGCISPWNLPLYLFTWKIAPALAAGCTVVAKPSEVTPMTAFMLSELCIEAGFPPGVLNIVHGLGAKAGQAIVSHPDVPVISFTGGSATGASIARTAGPMFKKVSLELGGKNPNLIFADANLQAAIKISVQSSFANQGQICLCGSRIFAQRAVFDQVVDGLVAAAKSLKVGDPLEEETKQGAIVSKDHLDKVLKCIDLAKEEGGTIHCGGDRPPPPPEGLNVRCKDGFFLNPAVITGLGPGCRTNQEEIFGPVVTVTPFDDEDEAITMANSTVYGLSSTVWTSDLDRAHRVAGKIQAGTVWINCWLLRDLRVPFGGMKQSGVGREGGEYALNFFTEPKNICVKINHT
ncbi:MAG: aldehyde dehydrogenase [Planctomycetota bacterium]|nr:aldehyde dehydrogenase [Planctomycetota bacterium]